MDNSIFPYRTILDNFGHLSSTDRSILMMYPLQRVGSLLTVQESSQIASIYEKLASSSQTPRDKLKNKSRGKEENMDRGQVCGGWDSGLLGGGGGGSGLWG